MTGEIWKDVIGYEGYYKISNFGRVKSVERAVPQGKYGNKRVIQEKIMHPTDNGYGYLVVSLRIGNKRKNAYIHRLVAQHFLENPNGYTHVNHLDFNKKNNNYSNLEWCTQNQNVNYSVCNMKHPKKNSRPTSSGEKYIHFKNNRYRLVIKPHVDKTFKALDDAVSAREVIMSGNEYFARGISRMLHNRRY